jgi:ABC-type glycerol-3-phosphate transport system substrate-binding protein
MKRVTVFVALLALLAIAIVPALAQDEDPVTLRVMNYSAEQQDFYDEVGQEFFDETGIQLEWETLSRDAYNETLPRMFDDGSAPDVFFWLGANRVLTVNELLDAGWIQPLEMDVLPEDWMSRWPDGSFVDGINVIDGNVYSFPFNDNKIWGPGYMYVNNQVWEDAGLSLDDMPETWSELREDCQTVRESGPYCIAIPLEGTHFQRTWYPLTGTIYTDQLFDYQTGRYNIDDPRMLETFEYVQSLYADDLVIPGINGRDETRASMAFGEAAIYFGGAWMPSVFANTYEFTDVTAAPAPHPDDGLTGALAQTNSENKYFISSTSQNPTEATTFIEWMTRPDGFFASNYLERGFGTLAYSDNAEYITDPVMLQVVDIATQQRPNMRVQYPEPAVACPAVASSEAFINAENIRRNWEWEEMSLALVEATDFAPVAQEIAASKNEAFLDTLDEEGIDPACFAFPDWELTSNFDPAMYEMSDTE